MKILSTCRICEILIKNNNYERDDMLRKLDIFLLGDRITEEEYKELTGLLKED